jgi:alanyl-tRNA synthetase
LKSSLEEVPAKIESLQDEVAELKKELANLRAKQAFSAFDVQIADVPFVFGVPVLTMEMSDADPDTMRLLADRFTQKHTGGTAIFANNERKLIAVVGPDLVKRGIKAGDLLTGIGAKGGGRPNLAQGSLPNGNLKEALDKLKNVVEEKLK